MSDDKYIKIRLLSGNPQGILITELTGWSGLVLSCSCSHLDDLLHRSELEEAGVCFLTSMDSVHSVKKTIFIGGGENIGSLISRNRHGGKGYPWERVFVITSRGYLTGRSMRYLARRIIKLAIKSEKVRAISEDDSSDAESEAEISYMESFISDLREILYVLGMDFLENKQNEGARKPFNPYESHRRQARVGKPISIDNNESIRSTASSDDKVMPNLVIRRRNLNAKAIYLGNRRVLVLKGSECTHKWKDVPWRHETGRHQFSKLVAAGVISVNDSTGKGLFTSDYEFSNPSGASTMVIGRGTGGYHEWLIQGTRKTLGEWLAEQGRRE